MTGGAIEIARRDGRCVVLSPAQLNDLAGRISGGVLRPDDGGWTEAVRIWNAMAATTPSFRSNRNLRPRVAAVVGSARV